MRRIFLVFFLLPIFLYGQAGNTSVYKRDSTTVFATPTQVKGLISDSNAAKVDTTAFNDTTAAHRDRLIALEDSVGEHRTDIDARVKYSDSTSIFTTPTQVKGLISDSVGARLTLYLDSTKVNQHIKDSIDARLASYWTAVQTAEAIRDSIANKADSVWVAAQLALKRNILDSYSLTDINSKIGLFNPLTGVGSEASPYTDTDSTGGIQTKINSLASGRGGKIFLENKRYDITNVGGVLVNTPSIYLEGAAAGFNIDPNGESEGISGTKLNITQNGIQLSSSGARPGAVTLNKLYLWGNSAVGKGINITGYLDQPHLESINFGGGI
jgi:hypothetical protein